MNAAAAVAAPTTPRAPARRRTELGLIVLAVLLVGGLYAIAGLGKAGSLPANIVPFLLIFFALLVVAHVAMRYLAPNADPILLPTAGLLNGVGYTFIARLSSSQASKQAAWTALGFLVFIATLAVVRRGRDLERYRYLFAFAGIGLLLLPLVPHIGENINGARLWIHLGSFSFQPGELAKLALAVFFASVLVERADLLAHGTVRIGRFLVLDPRYLAPIIVAWGLSLLIFLAENDLGSSFLFFALFIGMLWMATGRAYYLGLGVGLFAAGAVFALKVIGHAQSRVQAWLDPWAHPETTGYQIIQGQFAIADGSVFGTGPGQSNASHIPYASSDFIFAVVANELGLVGAAALLMGYLLMVGTGLRIALRADRQFEKLLAAGLALILGVQTFVIVGGVTRLIPLTGITLPFVSYGGSSLIANWILVAVLLRISDDTETPMVVRPSSLVELSDVGLDTGMIDLGTPTPPESGVS
ncbi:FtsW/RodA/SpoVE family cell cycle protein [Acidiferrimicrobium sp. IK]|uniref:FtsW/RodA/SpoVE family cell cycle protein n=1 Tax=Acidiferrimicrobium sp. IK TaxID=2871700 RepID=UPI0021CB4A24|nr:FtsW/RodA/SpoVE family cell cycle protein [Acidiferrimicrobium sp. IK]MCU4186118.1 FtsW/RodA/SpoVE family cell cycle protein [Acidiferrimicrobium sp. IK]